MTYQKKNEDKDKKLVAPKVPVKKDYASDGLSIVEEELRGLRAQVKALERGYDKRGSALDEAERLVGERTKDKDKDNKDKPDYTVSTAVARKAGKDYADKVLRRVASSLREISALEQKLTEASQTSAKDEFARKRIEKLNKAPYKELEAARLDKTVYEKLIQTTYWKPEDDPKAKPEATYATEWVNTQLAERIALEALSVEVQAETKRVKNKVNPPKPKKENGNGEKEENGKSKPRRRPK